MLSGVPRLIRVGLESGSSSDKSDHNSLLLLISPTYIVESDAVKTLFDLLLGLPNSHGGLNSMLFSGAT